MRAARFLAEFAGFLGLMALSVAVPVFLHALVATH